MAHAIALNPQGDTAADSLVGNGQVELRWAFDDDDAATAATSVQYKWVSSLLEDSGWKTIPGKPRKVGSYVVSGLSNGIEYTFTIRAIDADGSVVQKKNKDVVLAEISGSLDVTPFSPAAAGAPDPPTGEKDKDLKDVDGVVKVGTDGVKVSWVASPSAGVTGYELEWRSLKHEIKDADGKPIWNGPVKVRRATPVVLRSLADDTYYFQVRAVSPGGPSEWHSIKPDEGRGKGEGGGNDCEKRP